MTGLCPWIWNPEYTYPLISIRSSSVSPKIISFSQIFALEHGPEHQDHCYWFSLDMFQFVEPKTCMLKERFIVLFKKKKKKKSLKMRLNTTYFHIRPTSPSEWGRLALMWTSTGYHIGSENLWNLVPISTIVLLNTRRPILSPVSPVVCRETHSPTNSKKTQQVILPFWLPIFP